MSMNAFTFIFADTKINKFLLIFTNCQSESNKKSDEFLTKLSTCTNYSFDDYAVVSPAGAQRGGSLTAGGVSQRIRRVANSQIPVKCPTRQRPA